MTTIDKIFLANVVQYLDNYLTAQRLTFINKKCRDALQVLRINPNYQLPPSKLQFPRNVFLQENAFRQSILMFPKLESIYFNDETFKFINSTPHWISHVRFNKIDISHLFTTVPLHLITEAHVIVRNRVFDFATLPNIKKITVEFLNPIQINQFFGSEHKKFEFVRIKMVGFFDKKFVENISRYNFHKIILEFDNKRSLEECITMKNIFNKATICYNEWYYGISPNVIVLNNPALVMTIQTSSFFTIKDINDYYPSSIKLKGTSQGIMDLTKCTFIKNLDNTNINAQINLPSSLISLQDFSISTTFHTCSNLQSLKLSNVNVKTPIQLQNSITSLSLNNTKSPFQLNSVQKLYQIKLQHDNWIPENQYMYLTRLEFSDCAITVSMKSLINLKEVHIVNCSSNIDVETLYPLNLNSLSCPSNLLPKQLNITKLCLNGTGIQCDLGRYSMLVDLTIYRLSTNSLRLPESIQVLQIYNTNSAHVKLLKLKEYMLHEIVMGFCCEALELPKELHTLILYNSPCRIINVKEVTIHQLAVINSQFDCKSICNNDKALRLEKERVVDGMWKKRIVV